jgi:hypothetical protein
MLAGRPSRVVSRLSVCGPDLPICITKRPSWVNFRIWPSCSPLPASQTKPLWSMWMPCSFCGQS